MSVPQLIGVAFATLPIEVESIPHGVRVVVPDPAHTSGTATATGTRIRKPPSSSAQDLL